MASRWIDSATGLGVYFRPSPVEVALVLPLISFVAYWGGELFFWLIR